MLNHEFSEQLITRELLIDRGFQQENGKQTVWLHTEYDIRLSFGKEGDIAYITNTNWNTRNISDIDMMIKLANNSHSSPIRPTTNQVVRTPATKQNVMNVTRKVLLLDGGLVLGIGHVNIIEGEVRGVIKEEILTYKKKPFTHYTFVKVTHYILLTEFKQ